MKVLALYSIKGGVGKTAAAVNLAHAAAASGVATLLVDLDAQAASSFYLRVRPKKRASARRLVDGRRTAGDAIRATDVPGLDILPAHFSFRKLDRVLDELKKPRRGLRSVLRPKREHYDLVVLDCPPNLTLVAENVFRQADVILVPVIPTTLSQRTFELLRDHFKNEGLDRRRLLGFFSLVDKRKSLHREMMQNLPSPKRRFCKIAVPYCAEIEKMGLHRRPVAEFAPRSTGAAAVSDLWVEVRAELDI